MSEPGLYTSLSGRIGRKTYWFGLIRLAIIGGGISIPMSIWFTSALMSDQVSNQLQFVLMASAQVRLMAWINLILVLMLTWPYLALMAKRLHDRGKSARIAIVMSAAGLAYQVLAALGIGFNVGVFAGRVQLLPTLPLIIAYAPFMILGLYLFVVLGFFKGKANVNAYGSPPAPRASASNLVNQT